MLLRHLRSLIVVCASFLWIAPLDAADLPTLKPLTPLRLDLASSSMVIVAPQTSEYRRLAKQLCDELARVTHRVPRIVSDSTAPTDLGAGPIVVLGNLMDSRLARRLYFEAYDFTDYAWPSPGGHVVRTIRDPWGTGAHVIMLGGSDTAGASEATKVLAALVRQRGSTLGYVNQVKLGRWASLIEASSANLLRSDSDATWMRSGSGSGFWDHQVQIAKAATGYLRTGNEAFLTPFRRELRYWLDHTVSGIYYPTGDVKSQVHGFINTILIPWDLVADHPAFSLAERHKIDADFLWVLSSTEGPGRIEHESRKRQVRSNHGTRAGMDAFFGGRYFSRRYGLEEGRHWLEIADRYFAPQMDCYKPYEDSWGHQWAASMSDVLVYYLAADKYEYLQSRGFKLAADRALIAHPPKHAPLNYMSACAAASGDTGYLSGWADKDDRRYQLVARLNGRGDEFLRGFCTGEPVISRNDVLGVAEAPLDKLWYETINRVNQNEGILYVNTVPREACFDKISLREGWSDNDYYLLLDGISGGGHAFQDANCIVRYAKHGVIWANGTYQTTGTATVRAQNGVFTALDGTGAGRLHRYARKLYAGSSGDYMAVAAALEGLGDVDWQRHVVRKRGSWTVVIDRAIAKRSGELLAERHWHIAGQVTPTSDGLVSESAGQYLHLQTVGVRPEGMRGKIDRAEIVRTRAVPARPLAIAALLYVNSSPDKRDARLTETDLGWRVEAADGVDLLIPNDSGAGMTIVSRQGAAVIGSASAKAAPGYSQAVAASPVVGQPTLPPQPPVSVITLPWHELHVGQSSITAIARADDGRLAAGTAQGNVVLFGAGGARQATAKLPSAIVSLHYFGGDLLVGEERGVLSRMAADSRTRWQHAIPYVNIPWPNWGEGKSRIREIASADMRGDGQTEILVADADRRVYAFSDRGRELWRTSVEWGVYTAMSVGTYHGRFALLGGTSQPSVWGRCLLYGAQGKVLAHYARPDLQSWCTPSQFRDMRLADLDGDGKAEIVNAVDTDCRQLVVYKEDGEVLWDADVAGSAEAVAVVLTNGTRGPVVYCASASGYVYAFDGRTGTRRWVCFVGEPTHFVAPTLGDRVIAAARSGRVFIIGHGGELIGAVSLGQPITGLLRPGEDRQANAVVLGTRDGRLLLLPNTSSQKPTVVNTESYTPAARGRMRTAENL
jgi:outer membrane protein assembly factor BamB